MAVVSFIMHHGYAVTGLVLFLAAMGLPLPASTVLLAAGAAAHAGALNLWVVLGMAWAAAIAGDTMLFYGGRYTGWWLMGILCRASVNPEACIFSSAGYFYRRGPKTLLFREVHPRAGRDGSPDRGKPEYADQPVSPDGCSRCVGILFGVACRRLLLQQIHRADHAGSRECRTRRSADRSSGGFRLRGAFCWPLPCAHGDPARSKRYRRQVSTSACRHLRRTNSS